MFQSVTREPSFVNQNSPNRKEGQSSMTHVSDVSFVSRMYVCSYLNPSKHNTDLGPLSVGMYLTSAQNHSIIFN